MLILCYGITKSGSTLAFELVKGMLKSVGQPQTKLPPTIVAAKARINYIETVDDAVLDALLKATEKRSVAVKTHAAFKSPLFPRIEKLQEERKLQIISSYRDPRDIVLSLIDAGAKTRETGRGSFAQVTDMAKAIAIVERQIVKFRKWSCVRGSLWLNYETVAFSPDEAIDRIEARLGITCDREAAKRHAFEDSFTQQNKMKKRRFKDELNAEQKTQMMEVFGPFIRGVFRADGDEWFTSHRDRLLAKGPTVGRKPA